MARLEQWNYFWERVPHKRLDRFASLDPQLFIHHVVMNATNKRAPKPGAAVFVMQYLLCQLP